MKLPLYRQVYEELRKDIMDGIYLPGDYLPSIREEAKRPGGPAFRTAVSPLCACVCPGLRPDLRAAANGPF